VYVLPVLASLARSLQHSNQDPIIPTLHENIESTTAKTLIDNG
jgi:hypothetical protein